MYLDVQYHERHELNGEHSTFNHFTNEIEQTEL